MADGPIQTGGGGNAAGQRTASGLKLIDDATHRGSSNPGGTHFGAPGAARQAAIVTLDNASCQRSFAAATDGQASFDQNYSNLT
jgi:hypothetical protein